MPPAVLKALIGKFWFRGQKKIMQPDLSDLPQRRVTAVLNSGSGSCDGNSASKLQGILASFGMAQAKVVCVGPSEIDNALADAVATSDLLIVLGGDGTIRTAAAMCQDRATVLLPLPGGTMNMLPKALYGAHSWEEALTATLAHPHVREVSGGKAAGQPFFCVALLGAPSLWAERVNDNETAGLII